MRPINILPACWKPLVADTVGDPDPGLEIVQSAPVWSTSGLQVAYFSWYDSCNNRDPGIYIADALGGARRRKLQVSGAYYQWLPGDTELIVNTGFFIGGELVIYNLASDSITPLGIQTEFPLFDVSDDGRFIYYEGAPVPQLTGTPIYEYDRVLRTERVLVIGSHPSISPNRTFLTYAVGPLFLYDFRDSAVTELAPSGSSPNWTPDGKGIVYSDRFGKIFITDLQGNRQLITGQEGLLGAFGPISLAPDGIRILYEQASDGFFVNIWQVNIDRSAARQFSR